MNDHVNMFRWWKLSSGGTHYIKIVSKICPQFVRQEMFGNFCQKWSLRSDMLNSDTLGYLLSVNENLLLFEMIWTCKHEQQTFFCLKNVNFFSCKRILQNTKIHFLTLNQPLTWFWRNHEQRTTIVTNWST